MGDTLEYDYTVLDTNEYRIPVLSFLFGSKPKEKEEQAEKVLITVSDIDSGGNYILTAEYTQQIIKSKLPVFGDVKYNSDSMNSDKEVFMPSFDEVYKAKFAAFLYHPFTIVVSASGNVISVTGIDAIVKAYENNIENAHLSASDKKNNIESLRKNLSNESIRRAMNRLFNIYPNVPVAVGSKWQKEIISGVYEPQDEIYHFHLKKITHDSVFIDASSDIDAPGDTTRNGTPTRLTGTKSGTIIIEKQTGVVLQKLFYIQLKGTTVEGGKAIKLNSSSLEKETITKKD